MAVSQVFETITIAAGEDLNDRTASSGDLYKAIAIDDGKPAANGGEAGGLLVYGAKSGENVTLGVSGKMKFVGTGTIAAGARLTVTTSGYLTNVGSATFVVGRALAACNSGDVGTGLFNFAAPALA